MKIGLVHRRFTTHGGTERYLVGLARWLVREGHEVHVLCNEVREDLKQEPGVRFKHLPMWRPGLAVQMASWWWSARRAEDAESWDAVMGFGRTPGHQLFRAGGGSHAAYLRRVHPWRRWVSPTDWLETALDRHAVESAQVVIANSRFCADDLREDYRAKRVEVVYNGVDLQRFRPDPEVRRRVRAELGAGGPVAAFVGTGFWRKGLDVAIASLPPGFTLWVVGKDTPWPAPEAVKFLGPVQDVERILQAADVMLLPTRYDPFANVCLEAMACGIPALTTPDTGAAEVLPEPWMVCRSPDAFRQALQRVDPELGLRCRAVAENHTPAASYSRAFELLKEAVR